MAVVVNEHIGVALLALSVKNINWEASSIGLAQDLVRLARR